MEVALLERERQVSEVEASLRLKDLEHDRRVTGLQREHARKVAALLRQLASLSAAPSAAAASAAAAAGQQQTPSQPRSAAASSAAGDSRRASPDAPVAADVIRRLAAAANEAESPAPPALEPPSAGRHNPGEPHVGLLYGADQHSYNCTRDSALPSFPTQL